MQSEPDRLLDVELDAALAAYGGAEPRAGLEKRVLARVRAVGHRAKWMGWVAASMLAVVAAVVLCWPVAVEELALPKPAPVRVVALQPEQTPKVQQAAVRRAKLPRLPRFPRATPMTEEERMLLQLAQSPEQAKSLLAGRYATPIEPIQIKELRIGGLNEDE